MESSAREGLLVDGAGAPLAEEDSGSVDLLDGTHVAYRAIVPDNATALQRFHHRLSERSIYCGSEAFTIPYIDPTPQHVGVDHRVWMSSRAPAQPC